MVWTLADLLGRAELRLALRYGNEATPVRWAHVSDLPDPTPYLDRDWLLLTTGLSLSAEQDDCSAYVERLVRAGVAALGFGIGPVRPAIPDGLMAAANRFGLPLIEVPEPTRFSDVVRAVAENRARADVQARLRSVLEQQRQLIDAAEARPSRRAVVSLLARHLGAWAMVLTPDGRFLVGAPETAGRNAELVGMELGKGPASTRTFGIAGERVVLIPFGAGRSRAWLAVGRPEPLTALEMGLVETAIALLRLDGARATELLDAERRERRIVLDLLLAGRDLLAERATETLGLPFPDGDLRIALLAEDGDGNALLDLLENDRSLQVVSALVAPEPRGRAAVVVPDVEGVLDVLQGVLSQVADGRGVVSEPIGITGIPQAWRRLGTLINAVAAGSPTRLAVAGDVAAEGLLAHLDAADVRGWADALLSPFERSGRIDLLGTVRTYLAHNCNSESAAAALGIHRRTLGYRLDRAEEALARSLADPALRAELWIALRLRDIG